jgi:hemolysin E
MMRLAGRCYFGNRERLEIHGCRRYGVIGMCSPAHFVDRGGALGPLPGWKAPETGRCNYFIGEIIMATGSLDDMNKALDAADKYLKLYNKVVDQVIPWNTYQSVISEIERYKDQYSTVAATIVGAVKTLILNAQDGYHASVQTIYNWCEYARQILAIYVEIISDPGVTEVSADEKGLVITTLDEGISAMALAVAALEKVSGNFNDAYGKLGTLKSQLETDFSENSSWYDQAVDKIRKEAYAGAAAGAVLGPFGLVIAYSIAAGVVEGKLIPELNAKLAGIKKYFEDLKKTIQGSQTDITSTKAKLQEESDTIRKLQTSAKVTKTVVELLPLALKKQILEKVNALMKSCNDYQVRHGKKG